MVSLGWLSTSLMSVRISAANAGLYLRGQWCSSLGLVLQLGYGSAALGVDRSAGLIEKLHCRIAQHWAPYCVAHGIKEESKMRLGHSPGLRVPGKDQIDVDRHSSGSARIGIAPALSQAMRVCLGAGPSRP